MKIEIAYANAQTQMIIPLDVPEKTMLSQAIILSGILAQYPEIDLNRQKTGIYGVIKPLNTPLNENDRVEIYRPLPSSAITKRFERLKHK